MRFSASPLEGIPKGIVAIETRAGHDRTFEQLASVHLSFHLVFQHFRSPKTQSESS